MHIMTDPFPLLLTGTGAGDKQGPIACQAEDSGNRPSERERSDPKLAGARDSGELRDPLLTDPLFFLQSSLVPAPLQPPSLSSPRRILPAGPSRSPPSVGSGKRQNLLASPCATKLGIHCPVSFSSTSKLDQRCCFLYALPPAQDVQLCFPSVERCQWCAQPSELGLGCPGD